MTHSESFTPDAAPSGSQTLVRLLQKARHIRDEDDRELGVWLMPTGSVPQDALHRQLMTWAESGAHEPGDVLAELRVTPRVQWRCTGENIIYANGGSFRMVRQAGFDERHVEFRYELTPLASISELFTAQPR